MATQSILPPINHQGVPIMCRSAPVSPVTFATSRRRTGPRPPPAARTTLALNPDFNEFQDPVELRVQSLELGEQIVSVRKSLIPYREELKYLEYQYDPSSYDPQVKNMKAQLDDMKNEKKELDNQISEIRKLCQGSKHNMNDIQLDDLKQKFHAKSIVQERLEKKIQIRKDKLEEIMNSQTKADLLKAQSDIKELQKKYDELKKEGDDLYYQLMTKQSTCGSTQTTEKQKLSSYHKRLYKIEYEKDNKNKELRVMRDQFLTKKEELNQQIEQKHFIEKVKQGRDSWKEKLNIIEEDENGQQKSTNRSSNLYGTPNGKRPNQSLSARSPRNNYRNNNQRNLNNKKRAKTQKVNNNNNDEVNEKGFISSIADDNGAVPHLDYDLYGYPETKKSSTFTNLIDDDLFELDGSRAKKNEEEVECSQTTKIYDVHQLTMIDVTPDWWNPNNGEEEEEEGENEDEKQEKQKKLKGGQLESNLESTMDSLMEAKNKSKNNLNEEKTKKDEKNDTVFAPHFDYETFGTPIDEKRSTFRNMFVDAFDPAGSCPIGNNEKEDENEKEDS